MPESETPEPVWSRELLEWATDPSLPHDIIRVTRDQAEWLVSFATHHGPYPELPEWQQEMVQRLARGERLFISPARHHGAMQALRHMASIARLQSMTVLEDLTWPQIVVQQHQDEVTLQDWRERLRTQRQEEMTLGDRVREIGVRRRGERREPINPEEIPDVTDADRRRWARAIDNEPTYQGNNSGTSMTIDELLGEIDETLEDYHEEG